MGIGFPTGFVFGCLAVGRLGFGEFELVAVFVLLVGTSVVLLPLPKVSS